MRAVVQRVSQASVSVNEQVVGSIGHGLVILLGVTHDDTAAEAKYLAEKIANLRIFDDEAGKMNYAIKETNGAILSISQFTLYGDCRKGRRPSFTDAAKPDMANQLYQDFNDLLKQEGLQVETGIFQAHMVVSLSNDGPVTMILDTQEMSGGKE